MIFFFLHHHLHFLLLALDHLYHHRCLLFNLHHQFLIHFNHHHQGLIILLVANLHIPAQISSANFGNRDQGLSGNLFGLETLTLTREKEKEKVVQDSVQRELDEKIY